MPVRIHKLKGTYMIFQYPWCLFVGCSQCKKLLCFASIVSLLATLLKANASRFFLLWLCQLAVKARVAKMCLRTPDTRPRQRDIFAMPCTAAVSSHSKRHWHIAAKHRCHPCSSSYHQGNFCASRLSHFQMSNHPEAPARPVVFQ